MLLTLPVKGEYYAVDNLHGLDSAVAGRDGYILYHGRSDPYSTGNRYYSCAVKRHTRAKIRLEVDNY